MIDIILDNEKYKSKCGAGLDSDTEKRVYDKLRNLLLNYPKLLGVEIRKYGLIIRGFREPLYFDSINERNSFIRKFEGSLTYSTFSKKVKP